MNRFECQVKSQNSTIKQRVWLIFLLAHPVVNLENIATNQPGIASNVII